MHTVNASQAAVPFLEKSKAGAIVVISSVSGFEVDFAAGSYGAIKAALIHYAKGLSQQLIKKGIRVNTVSPGYVATDMVKAIKPDILDSIVQQIPMGRLAQPEEIAGLVAYLASDDGAYFTGQVFVIDPPRGQVIDVIQVGRGPNAVQLVPGSGKSQNPLGLGLLGVVANFADNDLSVVSLEPGASLG